MRNLLLVGLLITSLAMASRGAAQPQCGVVDTLVPPVDLSVFSIMQDFGVPNFRFRGWYHTGEDLAAPRGQSLGQPVRAIAAGRVTLSSPLSWGRDGGVVIIEHTFEDGSIFYSQYGHMREAEGAAFPRPYTCVAAGDIIGVIGEARPSPHLHFEIRINNFDLAGPGYTLEDPFALGYRRPTKMMTNWLLALSPALNWTVDLIDEAGPVTPPLVLDDLSLVVLDAGRVLRVTPDGRVLWRYTLEQPAAALVRIGSSSVIAYSDGQMQVIGLDGTPGSRWETGLPLASGPYTIGDLLAFRTADGGLAALSADGRSVVWRTAEVPPVVRWASSGGILALVTESDELLVLAVDGSIVSRQPLSGAGSVAPTPDGRLLAYDSGALWSVEAPYAASLPAQTGGSGLAVGADGSLYLLDAGILTAYAPDRRVRYQYAVPGIGGTFDVALLGDLLLFTSTHGDIGVVRAADGALCGLTRMFGDDRARLWSALGTDDVLRIGVADQFVGLDWRQLIGPCS